MPTGTVDTPFGYAGQYGYVYDKETGLYFLKSRYYDPEAGRFTTRDRFKGFENRPASQNAYTYGENDPVNKVDPSGYVASPYLVGWATFAGAIIGGIYNLAFYVAHNRNWTAKGAFISFGKGALAGGIVALITVVFPRAWIAGVLGAAGGVWQEITAKKRIGKSPSILDLTRKAMAGYSGGVYAYTLGRFIPNPEVRGFIEGLAGAGVAGYIGEW